MLIFTFSRGWAEIAIINRAVGGNGLLRLATIRFDIQLGDVFLLCSDGLSNEVEADELALALAEQTPQAACKRLMELALNREAKDNITVVVVTLLRH